MMTTSTKRHRVPKIVASHDEELERDEEEDRRNRFGHLLKPIRDLAENFNIDLANELEDYLDDLESITISFSDEEGIKKLNFAEAALLIRGSSLIYSKKVDYLYDLVFKVLDSVTAQRDKRIRVDLHDDNEVLLDEQGNVVQDYHSTNADFVDDFLTLDDIQESENISLVNGGSNGSQGWVKEDQSGSNVQHAEWDVDARRNDALNFAVPLAFLQSANIQRNGLNHFKLSSSHVHPSGALLLNPSSNMQYHHLSDNTTSMCLSTGLLGSQKNTTNDSIMMNRQSTDGANSPGHHDEYRFGGDIDDFGNDDFGNDNFDSGFDGADDSHGASVSQRLFLQPDDGRNDSRTSDPSKSTTIHAPPVDVWLMHDPHEQISRGKRPFRIGKMHTIPDLTEASTLPSGPVQLCVSSKALASKEFSYIVQREEIQKRKRRKKERRLKRQQLLEAEEARMAVAEEEYARAAAAGNASDMHNMIDVDVHDQSVTGVNGVIEGNQYQPDFDDGGMMDWGDDDGGDDGGGDNFYDDNYYDDEENNMSSPAHDKSYAQLCRAHVAAYMRGSHQYAQETNLTRRVSAWEDKLLPVLDEQFYRPQFDIHECGAQLLDTLALEIAENVSKAAKEPDDSSKKSPSALALGEGDEEEGDEEEGYEEQEEGNERENANHTMAPQFVHLAKKQQSARYEVCRLFLSMLQLANDGNVELLHDTIHTLPEHMLRCLNMNSDLVANHLTDSLRVRLLSRNKAVLFKKTEGFDVAEDVTQVNDNSTTSSNVSMNYFSKGGEVSGKEFGGVSSSRSMPLATISGNVSQVR